MSRKVPSQGQINLFEAAPGLESVAVHPTSSSAIEPESPLLNTVATTTSPHLFEFPAAVPSPATETAEEEPADITHLRDLKELVHIFGAANEGLNFRMIVRTEPAVANRLRRRGYPVDERYERSELVGKPALEQRAKDKIGQMLGHEAMVAEGVLTEEQASLIRDETYRIYSEFLMGLDPETRRRKSNLLSMIRRRLKNYEAEKAGEANE